MNVLFMGTPDFAVKSLEALTENNYNIVGVITQEDKPVGRKKVMTKPPVKVYAEEQGYKVLQPKSLRNEEIYNEIKELNPDVIVVVAYGKILPKNILDLPKYGCINVHGSILPNYRGSSPIHFALMDGLDKTGVTTMYMDEGLDTGDMLIVDELDITENDDIETLTERLSNLGAGTLIKTLKAIENGEITRIPQDNNLATHTRLIKLEDGKIDFENKTAKEIYDLYRAILKWPGLYCMFNDKKVKINKVELIKKDGIMGKPGEVVDIKNSAYVACKEGIIGFLEIQPENKKGMDIKSFVNGYRLKKGDMFI